MNNELELLKSRRSVRSYGLEPIDKDLRNKLNSEATFINTHEAGLNFRICYDDDGPFRGAGRSYGMLKNVRNYVAVIIDPTFPNSLERAGYFGEQFVMKCVSLGLGTCFVSGTFSADHVNARMEVYEKLPFVIAFGYPEEKSSLVAKIAMGFAHRKKMTPRDFFKGSEKDYRRAESLFGDKLNEALEAVACAPSAYNKRPQRIELVENGGEPELRVAVLDSEKDAIELGIARYNFDAVMNDE